MFTLVGGRVVYGAEEFRRLAPPDLPVSPDWSPAREFDGYVRGGQPFGSATPTRAQGLGRDRGRRTAARAHWWVYGKGGWWSLGCDCSGF